MDVRSILIKQRESEQSEADDHTGQYYDADDDVADDQKRGLNELEHQQQQEFHDGDKHDLIPFLGVVIHCGLNSLI